MAATFIRQQALLGHAFAVGRQWRRYAGLLACGLAVAIVAGWSPDFPLKQLDLGIVIGAFSMAVLLAIVRVNDAEAQRHGAEELSLESLRAVPEWLVIDNLPFDSVDVDHVVVTPATVLAVETKFHAQQARGGFASKRLSNDLQTALRAARTVGLYLRTKRLLDDASVTPVLMVWGEGRPELPHGHEVVDGVRVVDGNAPESWTHLFKAPVMPMPTRLAIYDAVAAFAQERLASERDRARDGSPRVPLWHEFRCGAASARRERLEKAKAAKATRRRHARH